MFFFYCFLWVVVVVVVVVFGFKNLCSTFCADFVPYMVQAFIMNCTHAVP
jgi:hypothetical protein